MSPPDFLDAALVLLGHGSTQDAEAGAPVRQHADELRRRGLFGAVREAFWKQSPNVKDVLASLTAPRVFIVPLFISEGYFSSRVIPLELGFGSVNSKLETPNSKLFYCPPIGTHARMTAILLSRAREIVARFPFPRAPGPETVTLFIAGHGTEQDQNSRQAIECQAERIRAASEYAAVHAVFLEESPGIGDCYQLAQTRNLVVVPFFISDGPHTRQDIPRLLGEPENVVRQRLTQGLPTWHNPTERRGKLVWYTSAAGSDPAVAEVILERVRETAAG